jgi:hypothetical protein
MNVMYKSCLLAVLSLVFSSQARGAAYSAKEIEAWVVDADSHQPLEGVNVVAHWALSFGLEGGLQTDLMLMEAVTDKAGRFYFPPWGPTAIPAGLPWEARLKNQDPAIIFFKSGYAWKALSNDRPGPHPDFGPSVRTSDWNGKTIELKKFDGDLKQYGFFVSGVLTGVSYGGCEWKKIPRVIVALTRESARLKQQKVFHSLPTIEEFDANSVKNNCGSAREFFNDYIK